MTKTAVSELTTQDKGCRNYYMAAKRKTDETISDVLRKAIAESELSFKALERETGVIRQSLMKFATGGHTIRLDAADKLADYFGLEVVKRKAR
jgi:plasmid maintenance system antidote protein VapI